MPRQYVYTAISNPSRTFFGKGEYLDYLRVRYRERKAWRNIAALQERCLARLLQVKNCEGMEEIIAFLNRNARDFEPFIPKLDITPENFRFQRGGNPYWWNREAGHKLWSGRIAYDYRERPTRPSQFTGWDMQDIYDCPRRARPIDDFGDVLRTIGFRLGSGGGMSIGYATDDPAIGNMGYEVALFAEDFPAMAETEMRFAA